ncbi:hypothetical protein [Archangium primigenium]|uniref:hypothetical protein n=1 Tax=[Archangium] primigenium TaxID=2792470 RepID=UPI00195B3B53|nr:hypothetical protein [Archangium primigenium]MBM7113182.1 hypothetical protein [Archangium primigenium]
MAPGGKRGPRWGVLAGAGALVGLVGGGLFLAAGSRPDPALVAQELAREARVNVLRLCGDVQAWRDEHGQFLAAGPVPAQVPRGGEAVAFVPDENLGKIGFAPGERVRCQYEVRVHESPLGEAEVTCFARGDLDGDGQVSVYSVTLDANGMTSEVKAEREGE